MSEEELQKKLEIAGVVGALAGFVSGAGLMAAVGILF